MSMAEEYSFWRVECFEESSACSFSAISISLG